MHASICARARRHHRMHSFHNLEHLADPVAAVLHYLDILKPGGGLGVVVPNWQVCSRVRVHPSRAGALLARGGRCLPAGGAAACLLHPWPWRPP